nr:hypothetical protein HmN_000466500 [Hymenolepis microstoma]
MSTPDARRKQRRLTPQEKLQLPIMHAVNCKHFGPCSLRGCERGRKVLEHAKICPSGENCPMPDCLIAKYYLKILCIYCRAVHSSNPKYFTLHYKLLPNSDFSYTTKIVPKPCRNLVLSKVTSVCRASWIRKLVLSAVKVPEPKSFYGLKMCNLHYYYTELESILFYNSRTPAEYYDSLEVIDKQLQRRKRVSNTDLLKVTWKKWTRAELLTSFLGLLEYLFKDEHASWFRFPVDIVALNIPDYREIVKFPMDLSTIRHKLECKEYEDPWDVVEDFNLIFHNAKLYNARASIIYSCTYL